MIAAREIDLKPFCSTRHDLLNAPFSAGGYTWASDGIILLRVPDRHIPPREGVTMPDVCGLWAKHNTTPSNFMRLPASDEPMMVCCDDCGGSGMVECNLNYEHPCDCDGGNIKNLAKVPIGISAISAYNLRRLAMLSDIMIAFPESRDGGIYFKFDGGDGLVMPIRI